MGTVAPDDSRDAFSAWNAVLLILLYLAVCGFIPVALNQAAWSRLDVTVGTWLDLMTSICLNGGFFICLDRKLRMLPNVFHGVNFWGILASIGCALLFYVLIDLMLDPLLHARFPASSDAYRRTLALLRQVPVANYISVCVMTPVVEETLMRGYVLGGLRKKYGVATALALSTLLFAVLHFNSIQTLSAILCGFILGLLYVKTESLFCCIAAHSLYNSILFVTTVMNQPL